MQVYFIDNEEYFHRKAVVHSKDTEEFFGDNDERMMFFGKGVLETVKKLGWVPDVIHCHGWMSALVPVYVKQLLKDDPIFADSKVVFSLYNNEFAEKLDARFYDKMLDQGFDATAIDAIKDGTFTNLNKLAIQYSDAVVQVSEEVNKDILDFVNSTSTKFVPFVNEDQQVEEYSKLYDEITEDSSVLAD
jgi:starch synthase